MSVYSGDINPAGMNQYDAAKITQPKHTNEVAQQKPAQDIQLEKKQEAVKADRIKQEKLAEAFKEENLKKALENTNIVFDLFGIKREFSVHQKSKKVIVKILDNETGEVIREIPPEKFWDHYTKLQESIGLAVDMRG